MTLTHPERTPFQMIILPGDPGIDTMIMNKLDPGSDGIAIPDNTGATPGLDALVRAGDWIRKGYSTAVFLNCRDRNRIDLASRFRGAVHLGVQRIIVESGHHTRLGTIPEALPVYDLDIFQAVRFLRKLQALERTDNHPYPLVGMRTTIQDIDAFERARIQRICCSDPHFLVLSCRKPDRHIQHWLSFSREIEGFDRKELIWEAGVPDHDGMDRLELPDGMDGVLLSF